MKNDIGEVSSPEEGALLKGEHLSRRNVLRGAVAVGLGLLVPSVLLGCDSGSKGTSSTGSAPASPPAPSPPGPSAPDSAAPTNAPKVPQASVQYQTQPKGEQKCANCVNFIAESNTCKVVEGDISPEGWCTLWAKKA